MVITTLKCDMKDCDSSHEVDALNGIKNPHEWTNITVRNRAYEICPICRPRLYGMLKLRTEP